MYMFRKFRFLTGIITAFTLLFGTILIAPSNAHAAAAAAISTVETQGKEFNFLKSDIYDVKVSGDGGATWKNSFAYKTTYNISKLDAVYEDFRKDDTVSYTDFSSNFKRSVKVKVKLKTGSINSVVIRPSDYGIKPVQVDDSTYTFELSTAGKVSVEINESADGYVKHRLFIFANFQETGVPDPKAANVYKFTPGGNLIKRIDFNKAWSKGKTVAYFKKGLYYITEDSLIPSGMTVYLEPGAYVFGSFKSVDRTWQTTYDNITIKGRGILDSVYGIRSQIWLQGTNNKVDGIMLLHKYKGPNITADSSVSASWLVGTKQTSYNENQNVKVINWMHAGGLFGFSGEFVVNDCFIFTNDDCIDISFPDNAIITNNITWNYYNGSALCVSWNSAKEQHQALVDNLDVIHWDSKYDDPGCNAQYPSCNDPHDDRTGAKIAVIFASHDSDVSLKNFTIQNVRVEKMSADSTKRFLSLCVYDNAYSSQGSPPAPYHGRAGFGSLQDVYLKNITIDESTSNNVIHGYDSNAMVSNVTFDNLKVNGNIAHSLSDANITVNQYTSNITFVEENKINNWSFEADKGYKDAPKGWKTSGKSSADSSNGPGYGYLGNNCGVHYSASAYSVSTYQTVTGLPDGIYSASARVKSSGGQKTAVFRVSDFGGTTIDAKIPVSPDWTLVQIPSFVVDNGQCKLSFVSDAAAKQYIHFDDVRLYTEPLISGCTYEDGAVKLTFTQIKGDVKYSVRYGNSKGIYDNEVSNLKVNETSISVLKEEGTWYFYIQAESLAGKWKISDEVSVTFLKENKTAVTLLKPSKTLRNNGSLWVGTHIKTGDSPLSVKSLGRAFIDGNKEQHEVRIVKKSNKSLIASDVVNMADGPSDPTGFVFKDIEPVKLEANTEYYIMAYEKVDGDLWYDYDTKVGDSKDLMVTGAVWSMDCITFSDEGANWSMQNAYGVPNMKYTVESVIIE